MTVIVWKRTIIESKSCVNWLLARYQGKSLVVYDSMGGDHNIGHDALKKNIKWNIWKKHVDNVSQSENRYCAKQKLFKERTNRPSVTITYYEAPQRANPKIKWSRDDISKKVIDFETRKLKFSQRKFAKNTGVPRTTFQNCITGRLKSMPISHYIILEKYAKDRSGVTCNQALTEALGNFPVKVVQGTSYEGKGLIHHMTKDLNGHHSPDLFHVLYEISKGTSAPLSVAVRKAEKAHENSGKAVHDEVENKTDYENFEKRPVGRCPDFDKRISRCQVEEKEARATLELASNRKNDRTIAFFFCMIESLVDDIMNNPQK